MSIRTAGCICAAWLLALAPKAVCREDLIPKLQAAENAGQLDQAQRWARLIIKREETVNPGGSLRPMVLEHLASLLQDQARFTEAEQFYKESIRLGALRPEAPSPELANALNNLGSLYNVTGHWENAEGLCRRALAIRLECLGPNNVETAVSYSNLGVILLRRRQPQKAEAMARQALAIWSQLHSSQDRSAVDLNTLTLVRRQEGRFNEAIAYDQAAIQKGRTYPPPNHWSLVSYLHTLAVLRWDAGDRPGSLASFQETLDFLEASSFPSALEKANLLGDYAQALRSAGQKKKARTLERQAKAEATKILQMNPARQYVVDVSSLKTGAARHSSGASFIK